MRENEPVLLVLSVCDEEIILEKGEILPEKRHCESQLRSLLGKETRSRQANSSRGPGNEDDFLRDFHR